MVKKIQVIGGGLAGCEAALFLANHGLSVILYDMKPDRHTEVHKQNTLAELVCSNSFRSDSLANAVGLLKAEMRMLNSAVMDAADRTKIPAGSALAVDRTKFSKLLTDKTLNHPNIEFVSKEITAFKPEDPGMFTILSPGPLATRGLTTFLKQLTGERYLKFYDAIAPIISRDSIDETKTFMASRYDKGGADYLNCPMDRETYLAFLDALIDAETVNLQGFEKGRKMFEGCLPVEEIARRGEDALKQGEQRKVFRMIPGLESAQFERYGSMHRNTFINSPELLNADFSMKKYPSVFVAGQISGVEGYLESAASGLIAAVSILFRENGIENQMFPETTMLGGLSRHISTFQANFQPSNAIFAMVPPPETKIKGGRRAKREFLSMRALQTLEDFLSGYPIF